jgi:BolA family transcriptional regulator, general stress-responsive regulator
MDRRQRIEMRLRDELAASHVDVADESHLHAGHAGAASGGGHFRATIVSDRFAGLSHVARQRLVYTALAAEMKTEIHALAMRTFTPEEWAARAGADGARLPR